jgi:uncharacterized protein (UPF0333 family)
MNTAKSPETKSPEQIHKGQVWKQVLIPFIVVCIINITVFIYLILETTSQTQIVEQWAQISTMFILLPIFLLGVIFLAVIILFIFLAGKLNKKLPSPLGQFRRKTIQALSAAQTVSEKPARLLIKIKSIYSGIKHFFIK